MWNLGVEFPLWQVKMRHLKWKCIGVMMAPLQLWLTDFEFTINIHTKSHWHNKIIQFYRENKTVWSVGMCDKEHIRVNTSLSHLVLCAITLMWSDFGSISLLHIVLCLKLSYINVWLMEFSNHLSWLCACACIRVRKCNESVVININ